MITKRKTTSIVKLIAALSFSGAAALTVSSCADGSGLRMGPVLQATNPESVKVLAEKPNSSYTTLGLVESSMDDSLFLTKNYTAKKAMGELRAQAAELGANAVIIKNYTSSSGDGIILGRRDDISVPMSSSVKRLTGIAILVK